MEGLARLLVLEKLSNPQSRVAYLNARRKDRGRPDIHRLWHNKSRKYKGDLKSSATLDGLEMNDYDVASLHMCKAFIRPHLGLNSCFGAVRMVPGGTLDVSRVLYTKRSVTSLFLTNILGA